MRSDKSYVIQSLPLTFPRVGILVLTLGFIISWSAPRKNSATGKTALDKNASRAPVETVFVTSPAVAPPPIAAPTRTSASSSTSATEEKRSRTGSANSLGPIRDFDQAYGLSIGYYNAEVLGNNPYVNFFWDLYPDQLPFFFEFTGGVGTLMSGLGEKVIGGDIYPHNILLTTEALGGYSLSGFKHGNGRAGGLFPYFVAGITVVYQGGLPFQGGVPNIGGVIGFGNRTNLPFGRNRGNWAFNYGLHDQIYSQKIRNPPSITQSFIFFLGVQKYY